MNRIQQQREDLLTLADLYTGLAEVLAADKYLPEWLGRPGREWPLWQAASALASRFEWPALSRGVEQLAEVTRRSPSARQLMYEKLLSGNGRLAPVMMHESQVMNGRFLGPLTFTLQALYQDAGLETVGSELPDYAPVELEFLSYLIEREEEDAGQTRQWRQARRHFLKEHAGQWLPQVARRLAQSDDEAWSAVGTLLAASLHPPRKQKQVVSRQTGLPHIPEPELCTLCSFCVQVCPTHALMMQEDDLATQLMLTASLCIHCHKCEQVCEEKALNLLGKPAAVDVLILRESPRAACPRCGKPTVSEAEISAIVQRLGEHPAWIDYCLQCR